MESLIKYHKKYRWFYTSTGKLVIGGKSAIQNDELLSSIKKSGKEFLVMHTAEPGSPFSVILDNIKEIKPKDKEECAIFTGCFSRAWKSGKKQAKIHSFFTSQLYKHSSMSTGTWGVHPPIEVITVSLNLVLTKQNEIVRAVPEQSVKNKQSILMRVKPGKVDKLLMIQEIKKMIPSFSTEEILAALPAGGLTIVK